MSSIPGTLNPPTAANPHNEATFRAEREAEGAWMAEYGATPGEEYGPPPLVITDRDDLVVEPEYIERTSLLFRLHLPPLPIDAGQRLADLTEKQRADADKQQRAAREARSAWTQNAWRDGPGRTSQPSDFLPKFVDDAVTQEQINVLEAVQFLRTRIGECIRPVCAPEHVGLAPAPSWSVMGSLRWGQVKARLGAYSDRMVALRAATGLHWQDVADSCRLDWSLREINGAIRLRGAMAMEYYNTIQQPVQFDVDRGGAKVALWYGFKLVGRFNRPPHPPGAELRGLCSVTGHYDRRDWSRQVVPGRTVPWAKARLLQGRGYELPRDILKMRAELEGTL